MKLLRLFFVRIGGAVATVAAVSVLLFVGVEFLPGDAAQAALGQEVRDPQLLAATRKQFGLDRPIIVRYGDWISGVARGNLGKSLPSGVAVSDFISRPVRNTAVLAVGTVLFLVPLATGLGMLSALHKDSALDHGVATTTMALISTPEFVIGVVLTMVFASGLGILPAVSLLAPSEPILAQVEVLILPIATLVLVLVAQATRMIRATTIDVLQSDYVQLAILRGTPRFLLLRRHVVPNAFAPTIQILALTVAYLAGGVVITETVFQYPGLGMTLVNAVQKRDLPTVQAIGMIVSTLYVVGNLIADMLVMALNPRLRRAG